MTVRFGDLRVTWFGYATVRIETPEAVVCIDPGRYGVLSGEWEGERPHPPATDYHGRDADLVLVTHDHHYDSDAIGRVAREDATVVVHEAVSASRIDRGVSPVSALPYDVRRVDDEAYFTVDGVDVWSVAAYNDTETTGRDTHAPGTGCGYLVSVGGQKVFWPGDTDVLPGHDRLSVDLFLANIGGSVVMDRHEAAGLAESLDPDLTLPVHYNTFDLLATDSRAFAADVAERGVPVVLDERGPDA